MSTKILVESLPNEITERDRAKLSLGAEGTFTSLKCNVGACALRATAITRVDGQARSFDFSTSNPGLCERGEESIIPGIIQHPKGDFSVKFVL